MPPNARSKVQDQTFSPCVPRKSRPAPPSVGSHRARSLIDTAKRSHEPETVNYMTGCREVAASTPAANKLVIEGGVGSLVMDLRGIGIELHREAFAFRMPDDSLVANDVRRGDIAIVEPCVRELSEGDLVVVALDGIATLRRVLYHGKVAYFHGALGTESPLLPAWEHAFSGVVTAIFRVFHHGRFLPKKPGKTIRVPRTKLAPSARKRTAKTASPPAENRLRDDPPEARQMGWCVP